MVRPTLPAFSVAVIGLVQGVGVSQGTPNPDGQYPNVSRDFLGQGAANMATSLVGGIPAGGSVSGTVLIISAGARSRRVYFPAGRAWRDAWTGEEHAGGSTLTAEAPLERIPVFQRAGSTLALRG
jgi:hypothetical protein